MTENKYRVRGDFVLCRIVNQEMVGALAMPQTSAEGKRFIVEGVGPDVKDVNVGERVIVSAPPETGVFYPIPSSKDLFCVKQEFVTLVVIENDCDRPTCCKGECS